MLEIYDIEYKNNIVGEWFYDTERDKFSAKLLKKDVEYPWALFYDWQNQKTAKEVGDEAVRRYIHYRVCPRDRDNIADILRVCGLSEYSEWGIFRANDGMNTLDYIRLKRKI